VLAGKVTKIVVWRLDRLGRTAKGLVTLRDELVERKLSFVSLRDGMDPSTPARRLMFNIIASVAEYETEVRKERQLAGIERAKAECKTWGGRKVGTRITVTAEKQALVRRLAAEGQKIAVIARQVGLARKSVYAVLKKGAV
jgi:DNA invertase Pin-like site-specific DNA recombinase